MCDVHYRLCAKSARKPRLSAPVSPRPLSPRHKCLFYHRLLFSKKKKTKKRQESLGFFVDVEQRVAVGTTLAGLLIPLSDMNSRPCFLEPVLLPADFTAVISVSRITVVGVRCDRAECTKPWRALVCLVREWSQTPRVEANWNSFLTSSYSSSGCAVRRKENEV